MVREQTGAANGQTFGPGGSIVFCEQNGRRVSRMASDGSGVEPVVETWAGERLNSPNDVVCRSDGLIYFTDPPYGVEPARRALHFQGVFALEPRPGQRRRPPALGRRLRETQRPGVFTRRADALRLRHGALSRPSIRGREVAGP